jgi:hypothetical protein
LGAPQRDATDVLLNSYGLSLFSSKAGSHPKENVGSLSLSVGELWPEIVLLDEVAHKGTSAVLAQRPLGDQTSHSRVVLRGSRK